MWPVSFKAVKKKLKEHGKKKKDTGLEHLEYGPESSSGDESKDKSNTELNPVPDPRLENKYVLPTLPPPTLPTFYDDCRTQWNGINHKIEAGLSSSNRTKYQVFKQGTEEILMLGSLTEMRTQKRKAEQVAFHKTKFKSTY